MKNLAEFKSDFRALSWELHTQALYIQNQRSITPCESINPSHILTAFYSESLKIGNEEDIVAYLTALETKINIILEAHPQSALANDRENDREFVGFLLKGEKTVDILLYTSGFGWKYYDITNRKKTLADLENPTEKRTIAKTIRQNLFNKGTWPDLSLTIQLCLFEDDPRGPKLEALGNIVSEAELISSSASFIVDYPDNEETYYLNEEGLALLQVAVKESHEDDPVSALSSPTVYQFDAETDSEVLNEEELAPLQVAAKKGHLNIVNCLIEVGEEVDLKDQNGLTPLFWAVRNRKLSVVEALMKAGADCNYRVPMSINELQDLVATESDQVQKRMTNFIMQKSSLTRTAPIFISSGELALILAHLHIAAKKGHLNIVNCLIEVGEEVDLKDQNGLTPLFWAVRNRKLSVVEALMKANADCNYRVPMSIDKLLDLVATESDQVKERMANFIKKKSSLTGASPIFISSCDLASILADREIMKAVISLNSTSRKQLHKLLAPAPSQSPELHAPLSIIESYSFLYQLWALPMAGNKRKRPEAKEVPTEEQTRHVMSYRG
ncbi:ankyrin repeat domain-containing protein [Legionella sp. D16C41]|uniref:ankyrin repeat domain-containing protein n=1 Tax=Legionella sp. D16C41 TaxID=3402688 RepID=UPI003AF6C834